ncbi:hypothetical protein M902_1572 [Bacteriovorax sp. BAL6_X]|uniref:hypothetical protein n=1 Tax=Bacteriovorax sp. BAL6_X TaxID=1201290 RepID=UPI000386A140|nr:hypothetical protein [Bacteriovorax sp. BAL6_X]EPZ50527.1 hypothetical protein M902_1572 [Bacteriovorax sp. BAL6_X]
MMRILIFLTIFTLTSCTYFYKNDNDYPYNYQDTFTSQDYLNHLEGIANLFIANNRVKKANQRSRRYLNKIAKELYLNNQGLFQKDDFGINFYIVEDNRNFYFSLPKNNVFMSRGLLRNYMNSENIFVAVLLGELIRSKIGIYERKRLIPLNSYTIDDMIRINSLDLNAKRDLNNLVYEVLIKSGYDPEARLLWLQTLNRQSISFSVQGVHSHELSKEEFLLKNYMVNSGEDKNLIFEKNSSRQFYYFKESI